MASSSGVKSHPPAVGSEAEYAAGKKKKIRKRRTELSVSSRNASSKLMNMGLCDRVAGSGGQY